tara:strand:+ start:1194 stop:2750 length:1557 start_codon:yes stop_codon:yes gene_type:complete
MDFISEFRKAVLAYQNKEYNKTIKICEALIEVNETSDIYNLFGLAQQKKKEFKSSIESLNKAIKKNKNNFEAYNNLGISLKNTNNFELAEKMYLKSLELNPNYLQGIANLALLKESRNQHDDSLNLYLKALKLCPVQNKLFFLNKLRSLYQVKGDFNSAKIYAKKMLDFSSSESSAWETLSNLGNNEEKKDILIKLEEIILSKEIDDKNISSLYFIIGNIYESFKDFEKANYYLDLANQTKKKLVISNLNIISNEKKNIFKIFEHLELQKIDKNNSDKKIIFILGLPRSGSTLIEEIISTYKEVAKTGENNLIQRVLVENFYKDKKFKENLFENDILVKTNKIQEYYFNYLKEAGFSSQIYTDKSLFNFMYIGFIKLYFPNSKILITKRDLRDVFLSIYKNDFSSSFMNWAYDKEEILNFINIYIDTINFWKKIFKNDLYQVEYEKVVENPEEEIKKMVSFCGLDWDPECLNFYQKNSIINTASLFQARKPIYKSSKKSYQNYSQFFKDFFNLLESKI